MRRGWLILVVLVSTGDLFSPRALFAGESAEKRPPDAISEGLEKRIHGNGSLDDVVVDVVWEKGRGQLTACKVFGTGVGLWDRRIQFRLTKQEVLSVLEAVEKARFGTLDDSLPDEGDSEGRIRVFVGPVSRTVWQMGEHEPGAQELEELALTVLRVCKKPMESGITMSDMQDGLQKLEKGTLAPEALEVVFKRKTDHPGPGVEPEDWLVLINGTKVIDRVNTKEKSAPQRELALTLTEKEFRELTALLLAGHIAKMPESLYATQYTNLRVVVLSQTRNIQARQFAGMSPNKHGEKQAVFERIFDWGVALHSRAQKEGKPFYRQVPASPHKRREKEKEKEGETEKEKEKE